MICLLPLVEKGPNVRHISPGTNGTISAGSNGYALMLVRVEPLVPVRAMNRY